MQSSSIVDDHSFHHIQIFHLQVFLLALLVFVGIDPLVQLGQRSDLCGDVVDLGEIAGLVVAKEEAFVEAGDSAVVHGCLILLLKARRQA